MLQSNDALTQKPYPRATLISAYKANIKGSSSAFSVRPDVEASLWITP